MLDVGELTRTEIVSLAPSLRASPRRPPASQHLLDTTMLFAPKSGGVKRYLMAKRAWLARTRPDLRHTLVTPGARTRATADGLVSISAPLIPFGDGYRIPANLRKWTRIIAHLKPSLIEAGDAYVPGHAALEAAEAIGAATIGFCHSDPAALAALHFGEWAAAPAQKRWAKFFSRFDRVIAPSAYIALRLAESGVPQVAVAAARRRHRHLPPDAGRPRSGAPRPGPALRYAAFGVRRPPGAGEESGDPGRGGRGARSPLPPDADRRRANLRPHPQVIGLGYVRDSRQLARLIASCDAFVHANDQEPFGLIVLEALAAGLPVVGPSTGGVSELIDEEVGQRAQEATPAGIAEAIDALFTRDLHALSRAARRRAEERHTWDRAFQGLMKTYGEVLGADLLPRLDA